MSIEKAPLVNRLILLVLTLILACLVVLLAQLNSRPAGSLTAIAANAPADETTATETTAPPEYQPLRPRTNAGPVMRRTLAPGPIPLHAPAGSRPDEADLRHVENPTRSVPKIESEVVSGGVLAGPGIQSGSGVFGQVSLAGTPPPEKTMEAADPVKMCGGSGTTKTITTRHYVVGADRGLGNVFVYIRSGLDGSRFPAPSATPVLDNINCQFEPYVMGVQTGQRFMIRNSDPGLHNVHALPKPGSGNNEFNFGLPLRGGVVTGSFPAPELFVRFKCDVHPWMFAYVSVLDHPFFSVTDTNGIFHLPEGLPPGRYALVASHLKAGETVQEIEVGPGEIKRVNFTLQAPSAP